MTFVTFVIGALFGALGLVFLYAAEASWQERKRLKAVREAQQRTDAELVDWVRCNKEALRFCVNHVVSISRNVDAAQKAADYAQERVTDLHKALHETDDTARQAWSIVQTRIPDLSDSIKRLAERVEALEKPKKAKK